MWFSDGVFAGHVEDGEFEPQNQKKNKIHERKMGVKSKEKGTANSLSALKTWADKKPLSLKQTLLSFLSSTKHSILKLCIYRQSIYLIFLSKLARRTPLKFFLVLPKSKENILKPVIQISMYMHLFF